MNPQPSTPRLSDLARHCILPEGIVSTDFPRYEKALNALGVTYDAWQHGLLMALFGKRKDGKYACGVGGAVLSIPRQVGKTFMIGTALIMHCALTPGLTVLWTAHHTRTSGETFRNLSDLVQRKVFQRFLDKVRRANGQQEISFTNGSRILFGAREQGFGRGFDAVDVIAFDECQILSQAAMEDMVPTTNASPNPLILYMGTPPRPKDDGEAFSVKRLNAIKGLDKDTLYVEFSADRTCDLDDREQWRKANPSYPQRTSESSILRMRRQFSDDSFRREALGIWDETVSHSVIDLRQWESATVPQRRDGGFKSYALDMTPDRSTLTIGACMKYEDGSCHIEMVAQKNVAEDGLQWAIDWLAERWDDTASVVIDSQGPAMTLVDDLVSAGVMVTVLQTKDVGQATGRFLDLLATGQLSHLPDTLQQSLAVAVHNVTTRPLGRSGLFGWNKTGSDVDISPLVACSFAIQGAYTTLRRPGVHEYIW
ncbi:terminase large subunit domain-containing protein [Alloscardovia macacae]|uniref:Terminase n=1 Tax=Alloscardovia macacae TaxID=1160091 RepID=A0A261F4T7_9BIFI|nr:terminase family protein [Alloscardovia macacae]OZG54111.1 terminase [Alloscardovia macacae]